MLKNFSQQSTFDKASTIALFLTIGIIAIIAVVGFLAKKSKQDTKTLINVSLGIGIGYSVGLVGILLFLKLDEYIQLGYIDKSTFIPILLLLCFIIIIALSALIISIFAPQKLKKFSIISLSTIAVILLVAFIFALINQYKVIGSLGATSESLLYVFTAILVAIICLVALLLGKKQLVDNTKSIVYAGICIATSFALSYIRLFSLPQGGSITLASLIPLMLYAHMFGVRKGVTAGIIYGFLQFIQAPWFYHPIQFLLDYPIAFGAIGLCGLLKELRIFNKKFVVQFVLGGVLAVIIRYFAHVISGIFVFGSGDPANYTAVAWSFLYNSFALLDMAISLVVGGILVSSKAFMKIIDNAHIMKN